MCSNHVFEYLFILFAFDILLVYIPPQLVSSIALFIFGRSLSSPWFGVLVATLSFLVLFIGG